MVENQKLVKISDIVENQIPEFILEDNPNFVEFLKQYYHSQEFQGGVTNIAENLFTYKNSSAFNSTNLIVNTTLTSDIEFFDDVIYVESTKGWPESYGLLKVNDEIITYTGITTNSFTGCVRGFSAIDSFEEQSNTEFLVFSSTESSSHSSGDSVKNLSNLFLVEFFKKQKYLYTPGFEEVDFATGINAQNFVSKAKAFYQSKGTDEAYKILFKVLWDENVQVIRPKDYLFTTSDDSWIVTETFVCDLISGDPFKIAGQTLYQDYDSYNENIFPANGSVYSVDSFLLDDKTYYKIRIFSGASNNLNPKGSISGKFLPTYKTKVVESVLAGQKTIFVDSTVGFPKSGILYVGEYTYTYTDKTNNQFLNVSTSGSNLITENIDLGLDVYSTNFVYSYEDGDPNKRVELRVNNLLSSIESKTTLFAKNNDPIKLTNIGNIENNIFVKSLKFNLPISVYSGKAVSSLTPEIRSSFGQGFAITNGLSLSKYEHKLVNGDLVDLFVKQQGRYQLYLPNLQASVSLSKEFSTQQINDSTILNKDILFRRKLAKTKAIPFTKLYDRINNKYTANIQDAYSDDNYNYITSNGLPDYEVNPYIKEFTFTTSLSNDARLVGSHNFYTGESVKIVGYASSGTFSNLVGFNTGDTYYVYRDGPSKIRLSETRSNVGITSINLLEFDANNQISGYLYDIVIASSPLYGNDFSSTKTFKKIPQKPKFEKFKVKTQPGPIGIFANGVEIQSYKSFDRIFYGKIESIDVLNSGENYSLTNPPRFRIFNSQNDEDLQTFIIPEMEGSLVGVSIRNSGYDYEDTPTVTITGGNRTDVKTTVKMRSIFKEIEFNATTRATVVRTVDNDFQFNTQHGFNEGEAVVYQTNDTFPIGIGTIISDGTLLDQSIYYVCNIGAGTSFRLANTREDALSKSNLINLRTTGGGVQKFRSVDKIKIIDEVSFVGIESGFKYKKLSFAPENINIFDNTFSFENHQYQTDEEVIVTAEGTYLSGAVENKIYYVDKIDDNTFRLFEDKDRTNLLNINSTDFSSTYFVQYPPIEVRIDGRFKRRSSSVVGYGATIVPIVQGYVKSAHIQRGLARPARTTLGSKDIVNYEKKPLITILEGSDAELQPIIENGEIIAVSIKNPGQNYFNDFDIIINGQGYGAEISPIISNGEIYDGAISFGQIIGVNIIRGGVGYASSDTTITLVNRGENLVISANLGTWTLNEVTKLGTTNLSNGCLFGSKYSKFGNTFGTFFLDSNLVNAFEIVATAHSPIIGWAYDGCPIYGPYAYENTDGSGSIVRMRSGYTRNKISPSTNIECIEDYVFTNTGTLDENNGRFAVTPDYPQGIYAYYCTLTAQGTPEFPYVIGDTYNYIPEEDNFDLNHNQELDFNSLGIVKYTSPYRVEDKENYYEYFGGIDNNIKADAVIQSASVGRISSITVVDGGLDYEVGDKISFTPETENGLGAFAEVDRVSGVEVLSINSGVTTFYDVNFVSTSTGILGIATTAHGFKSQTFINISGISTTDYSGLEGFRKIVVESSSTTLEEALPTAASVGLVTSLKVKTPIFKYRPDDVLQIGTELLKVIGVDERNNRLNVLRESAAAPGYAIGSTVSDFVTKFTFPFDDFDYTLNELDESYYFNPAESVSVGISTLPGVGNELTVYPLGYGVSITKFVEHGGILLPYHKFRDGEKVSYSTNASSIVTNAGNLESLPELYVVKLSPDIIGLVQSVKDVKNLNALLRFNAVGTGNLHKFKTQRNVVTGAITQVNVNVSTASSHGLSVGNHIEMSVVSGITSTYVVGYSTITKRVLINGEVNPQIKTYSNQTVVFDLTDPSISGKDFNLYGDDVFRNPYFGNESGIEVIKNSTSLTLSITEETPKLLYYNLNNITTNDEIYQDTSVSGGNSLKIERSSYQIQSSIVGITTTTFTYNLPVFPEESQYNNTTSDISYSILDKNVKGPINSVKLIYGGSIYEDVPSVENIVTSSGSGANLLAQTSAIGRPKKIKILNTSSVFSSDKTLLPTSNTYHLIKFKDNYKVSDIDINSTGRLYITPPTLRLYNKVEDTLDPLFSCAVELKGQSIDTIQIVNPSGNLKTTDNLIVSTNNSNGIRIISASVSGTGPYDISLTLETPISGFSTTNPLPFELGDEVFVENIISTAGFGYNSSDYKYEPFVLTFVNPNFDAPNAAVIRYQVPNSPGVFSPSTFNASVSKYSDLLKVSPILAKTEFLNGEKLRGVNSVILDNVENEPLLDIIKVNSIEDLSVGDLIEGEASKTKAEISSIETFKGVVTLDSSTSEEIGWKGFRGNLSTILQKLSDNDYYQVFSYTLKSKKSFTEWQKVVSDVSHVSGYKQFGDLSVESELPVSLGSTLTVKSDSSSIVNVAVVSESDVNKVSNFDLVIEEDIDDNNGEFSEFIKFGAKKISDYLLSSANRVLSIDNISSLFDTDNSPFVLIPVDTIDTSNEVVLKYFFFIGGTVSFFGSFEKPQIFDLLVTRNDDTIDLTSYAYFYDFYTSSGAVNFPLGEIEATLSPTNGDEITINFEPRNIFNSYVIRAVRDTAPAAVGVATTSYGYVNSVEKTLEILSSSSSPELIYSYPLSDLTSGTGFIGISSASRKIESAFEFSFIKNVENEIIFNVYAEKTYKDFGTFGISTSISGGVDFTFTPTAGVGLTVFSNIQIMNNNYVSVNTIPNELSIVKSELLNHTGTSQVGITTVPSSYSASKFVIEAQKTVGLSTQRSIFQINSVHFNDYLNNTVYGFAGNLDIEEFEVELLYNAGLGEYVLAFTPNSSADYTFKVVSKSLLSPNA